MDLKKIRALTLKYTGISNQIVSEVALSFPKALLSPGEIAATNKCNAIWDTGATACAITELTAAKLKLSPTGNKKVSGLGGTITKNTYVIDIVLPNSVEFNNVIVTEIDNPVDEQGNKIDNFGLLIGMDIIAAGDFSITNCDGKTWMSFRMPSTQKIDYVDEWNKRMAVEQRSKRK